MLHIYPDPSQSYLRRDIASFLGGRVTESMICAGTGSDELLDLVFRLFDPVGIVNLPPTFGMYPFLSAIAKAAVVSVDRGPAPHFSIDMAGVAAAVDAGATVIFAASPNNPTGGMLTHAEVRALCALPAIVVLDEAYAEFSTAGSSSVDLVAELPNLMVMRTFSKWAGLAGLRVGYSVSSPAVNAAIMAIKQPYNVNVAADVGARAALAHAPEIMRVQVGPMLVERERIARSAEAMGWLIPYPTSSNFILFEVRRPFVASEAVASLRAKGVLVRYYPSGRLAGCLRISAGRPQDTDRLLEALTEVGAEQRKAHGPVQRGPSALLFDMDGVLVEVAGSYRAAVIATAAAFNIVVTEADIDTAKAAGGANNDWALTHRLITAAWPSTGSQAPPTLAAVTAQFEALYQGDARTGVPGLKSTESALVSTAFLRTLKSHCPGGLAVVTGRPRSDAAEALARYGWSDVFDAVVCMEDAELKPHPAPVLLAVQRLNEAAATAARRSTAVSTSATSGAGAVAAATAATANGHAPPPSAGNTSALTPADCLMIGDTVDDVRSAIAAGARAVGAYPPDKAPGTNASKAGALRANLTSAGALSVLEPGCCGLLSMVAPSARESSSALFAGNQSRITAWRQSVAAKQQLSASSSTSGGGSDYSGVAHGTSSATAAAMSAGGARLTIGSAGGRCGSCSRTTKETSIYAWVNLDGTGEAEVSTG